MMGLMEGARVYHLGGSGHHSLLLPFDRNQDAVTAAVMDAGQTTAVTGPVFLTYNVRGERMPTPKPTDRAVPLTMVSIAGINFDYSAVDLATFVERENGDPITLADASALVDEAEANAEGPWRIAVSTQNDLLRSGQSPLPLRNEVPGFRLRIQRAFTQMCRTWYVTLSAMRTQGVQTRGAPPQVQGRPLPGIPVLSAIGCGAFRGPYCQVPSLWAAALRATLENHVSADPWFEFVLVCFPDTNADRHNRDCFVRVFATYDQRLPPVRLLFNHSMMHTAHLLGTECGKRTGILNPSDVYAVRKGHIQTIIGPSNCSLETWACFGTAADTSRSRRSSRWGPRC
jgi:hypothetical protein